MIDGPIVHANYFVSAGYSLKGKFISVLQSTLWSSCVSVTEAVCARNCGRAVSFMLFSHYTSQDDSRVPLHYVYLGTRAGLDVVA